MARSCWTKSHEATSHDAATTFAPSFLVHEIRRNHILYGYARDHILRILAIKSRDSVGFRCLKTLREHVGNSLLNEQTLFVD
jgi:hypothetical protein